MQQKILTKTKLLIIFAFKTRLQISKMEERFVDIHYERKFSTFIMSLPENKKSNVIEK